MRLFGLLETPCFVLVSLSYAILLPALNSFIAPRLAASRAS